ncbi:MAG TPA: hypothetical protein VF421_14175 [Niabella sp.]
MTEWNGRRLPDHAAVTIKASYRPGYGSIFKYIVTLVSSAFPGSLHHPGKKQYAILCCYVLLFFAFDGLALKKDPALCRVNL